jgi:hypothetical protein
MDNEDGRLEEMTARDPYGALGLEDDPELAFAGIRALGQMAEFCERYQGGGFVRPGTRGRRSPVGRVSALRRYTRSTLTR